MKNQKTYSWNRNTAHHRIAITRFSIFSFLQSIFVGFLVTLSMGIKSDGTQAYIVTTAICGLAGMVVTYSTFLMVMVIMYQWVNEQDVRQQPPPPEKKEPVDVFYQTKEGNFYRHRKGGVGG